MYAAGVACGAFIGKAPPALPGLRAELGLTLVQSGFIATMINLLGAIVGLLMGVLCDRYGHKRLGLVGLLVMAAGGFIGAAAQGYAVLLFSRFLEGAGFILFTVTGAALINASTANLRDRNRAMGLWTAYMPTGAALAMLVTPAAMAQMGWRGLWVALSVATLACVVLVWRTVPATIPSGVGTLRLARESLAQRGSWVLSVLFLFYVAQWTSVMVWLPTFVVDERGGSAATAAFLGALMVAANVPGNLAGGWLLSHGFRRGAMVVVASAISAACFAGMLGDWLPDPVRFALVLLFSCCAGAIPAAVLSGVPVHARSPGHIATTNGMVMQAAQLGQSVGPILLAWLASHYGGWSATLGTMLAFAAAAGACGVAVARIERARMSS
ncbi:MAG TPA: MFS transporter [Burkholderiales bacterium]|jgi:cyanate permease|nr:MFS transporter [Burkholderiales bacterium]